MNMKLGFVKIYPRKICHQNEASLDRK